MRGAGPSGQADGRAEESNMGKYKFGHPLDVCLSGAIIAGVACLIAWGLHEVFG